MGKLLSICAVCLLFAGTPMIVRAQQGDATQTPAVSAPEKATLKNGKLDVDLPVNSLVMLELHP